MNRGVVVVSGEYHHFSREPFMFAKSSGISTRALCLAGAIVCFACDAKPTSTETDARITATPQAPRPPKFTKSPKKETPRPTKLTPQTWVYATHEIFDDKGIVTQEGEERLRKIRDHLSASDFHAHIRVHTNPQGSSKYNVKKSQERARIIHSVLSEEKTKFSGRITAQGYGESMPAEEGVASRVEIELVRAEER